MLMWRTSQGAIRSAIAATVVMLLSIAVLLPVQAAPVQTARPDLVSAPFIVVAGRNMPWNSQATVRARQAKPVGQGLCEITIQHNVRNIGNKASGPFQTRFANSTVPGAFTRQWPSLSPGQSSTQTDILRLRAGNNTLTLTLDAASQVRESNESNNQYRVTLVLDGHCLPGKPGKR